MVEEVRQRSGPVAGRGVPWSATMTFGVLTLAAGIVALFWPGATVVLLALIFGAQLIVGGVFWFVGSLAARELGGGRQAMLALLAVLAVAAGILVLLNPFQTVVMLGLILGIFWVVGGLIQVYHGFGGREQAARGWMITGGVLSVLAGIALLVMPALSLTVITWVLGIWLAVFGLLAIGQAIRIRQARKPTLPAAPGPAPA